MKETEGAAIMKRITLESISNINIPEKSRKLPTEVYEFIACLLSEYAIGYLGFDSTDNNLYPAICKYFIAGEISAKSLIEDADIAEESSNYIKNQILQQTASSLLATANQNPSIALSLI